MSIIAIPLSDERVAELKQRAERAKVTPEELLRATVEEWLGRPAGDFAQAAEYVLGKNAELYRRLA